MLSTTTRATPTSRTKQDCRQPLSVAMTGRDRPTANGEGRGAVSQLPIFLRENKDDLEGFSHSGFAFTGNRLCPIEPTRLGGHTSCFSSSPRAGFRQARSAPRQPVL